MPDIKMVEEIMGDKYQVCDYRKMKAQNNNQPLFLQFIILYILG
jgi:hypothetical protein